MSAVRLLGLPPQSYEHPLDRSTLDALQGTPGLDTVVKKFYDWGVERFFRIQYTGSHIRVGPDSFPDLYDRVWRTCDVLDLPKRPDVYVGGMGGINAATIGVERPILVISSAAVDCLDDEELTFVIGHELGHIKSGHVLYRQMAEFLPMAAELVDSTPMGIGKLLTVGLRLGLQNWHRISEFTADRAGLLAIQNPEAAFRALMKIAGLPAKYSTAGVNTEDFMAQAREFQALDSETLNWVLKGLSLLQRSHPWTVMRAHELVTWIDSGEYGRIVAAAPVVDESPRFCSSCGELLKVAAAFCTVCGVGVPVASVVSQA